MSREIKFRGYTKCFDKNCFVYGSIAIMNEQKQSFIIPTGMITGSLGFYLVDPESVGQFTGLLDKNGNEIYEGDIIDIGQTVNGQSLFLISSCLPKLKIMYAYDTKRYYEYDEYELVDESRAETDIEIIGNIYEHPHLLK